MLAVLYLAWPPQRPAGPAPAPPQADHFAFVRSMEGTRPDGQVKTDSAERLLVDAELGYLFDYYLAGLGEKDLLAVRTEIERELDRRLRPAPAAEAKRLLASYLAYKRALADVEGRLPNSADMAAGARARLAAMQQLRPHYFTPQQIAGLFGGADAQAADTIARLELAADRSLTEAERQARVAALDQQLPPALREQRAAPTRVLRLEQSVQQLRAQGAGDNEIYRLRSAALSPEAASRLAEVDREDADWKRRIALYQAERRQLAAAAAGPSPHRAQVLRDAYFKPEEQRRLGAYE
jgi:lipase chaperone LimK